MRRSWSRIPAMLPPSRGESLHREAGPTPERSGAGRCGGGQPRRKRTWLLNTQPETNEYR